MIDENSNPTFDAINKINDAMNNDIHPSYIRNVIPELVNVFNDKFVKYPVISDRFVKLSDQQIHNLFDISLKSKFKITNKYISGVVIDTKPLDLNFSIFNKLIDLFAKDPHSFKNDISLLEKDILL